MLFSLNRKSAIESLFRTAIRDLKLDHLMTLIRSRQHIRRNRQTDLLRGFQVDHQLKLRGLLHWQVGGLGTLRILST